MKSNLAALFCLSSTLLLSGCFSNSAPNTQIAPPSSQTAFPIILLPELSPSSDLSNRKPPNLQPSPLPNPISVPSAPSPAGKQTIIVEQLKIVDLNIVMQKDQSRLLIVQAKDQNGNAINRSDLQLSWSVDRPDLFLIDQTGLIKVLSSSGSAIVRVSAENGPSAIAQVIIDNPRSSGGGGSTAGGGTATSPITLPAETYCFDNNSCQVSILAGTGDAGSNGNFGPAIDAQLDDPHGIIADATNNFFIADSFNHVIRQIKPDGTISTIAGLGISGFNSDNDEAHLVRLIYPVSLVAKDNQLYFSDKVNNRIRQMNLNTGNLKTIAGGGNEIEGNNALTSALNFPLGIAIYQNAIYIADSLYHRIQKLNIDTGMIETIVGQVGFGSGGDGGQAAQAELHTPHDLVVDASGNIYIADTFNHKIRKIDKVSQAITTIAGTGQAGYSGDGSAAVSAQLDTPTGIALSAQGSYLFIADSQNKVIRAINLYNSKIKTIAGGGTQAQGSALNVSLAMPYDVMVQANGDLYIVDSLNNQIKKVKR